MNSSKTWQQCVCAEQHIRISRVISHYLISCGTILKVQYVTFVIIKRSKIVKMWQISVEVQQVK